MDGHEASMLTSALVATLVYFLGMLLGHPDVLENCATFSKIRFLGGSGAGQSYGDRKYVTKLHGENLLTKINKFCIEFAWKLCVCRHLLPENLSSCCIDSWTAMTCGYCPEISESCKEAYLEFSLFKTQLQMKSKRQRSVLLIHVLDVYDV